MCGIVGIGSTKFIKDKSWIKEATDLIRHRGPDDYGEWQSEDKRVSFGHRRLSVIDLSTMAHQPMHIKEHGVTITFNGEIYNFVELRNQLEKLGHSFRSKSDTEVILKAYIHWGESFVNKLNGMFAFAIHDTNSKILLLGRDRAGEKPLYYFENKDSLYFSSELKALLIHPRLPRKINYESLDCYLAMGYVPGERCILDGYNKLPPGHLMTFDLRNGKKKIHKYWSLPKNHLNPPEANINDLVDELEVILGDAVRSQLIADVPLGILLSGGIDSSLITALASKHSDSVKTFSIGFLDDEKYDETSHARLVAKHFNTEHTELKIDNSTFSFNPEIIFQFDEPMVDSSMFPTWIVSNLISSHCKVALGGDGGDELFGGYNHYSRLTQMKKILERLPIILRGNISSISKKFIPIGVKGKNYLDAIDFNLSNGLPLIACLFDYKTRAQLLNSKSVFYDFAEIIRLNRIPNNPDFIERMTRMDFENYLPEDILVKVDRTSMHNSLEVRSPYLDINVIEFAFSKVHSSLKATTSNKKIILKELASKLLPRNFDKNRKQGFSIPMQQWLKRGPLRELFWDTLKSSDCLFDRSIIDSLLLSQDRGRNNGERLFALVQFELWRKKYKTYL